MSPRVRAALPYLAWLVVAAPAVGQLWLLATAVVHRFGYPYDLEWMEGGLLHHALRIQDGQGIYGPPSVEFIPYLYTPLYPGLLAATGEVVGLSYQLGRAISVLSLLGLAAVTVHVLRAGARDAGPPVRGAAVAGALLALGAFAAAYPYVDGWYDLVRADTLALLMATGGLALTYRTARAGVGWRGHARTAAAAALLALGFFAKQTGVLFVAFGGALLLACNWRRVPTYVAVAGAVGLGGTWLLQRATGGWFWTYAFEIHQAHDWNADRFWDSFGNVLWDRTPVLTVVIAATLLVVAATGVARRRVPAPARVFLVWTAAYAFSTVVGAVGWGTEFAHFNAYMPALLHGGLAAGAALPALVACVGALLAPAASPRLRRAAPWLAPAVAATAGLALGAQLVDRWWDPARFMPTAADRRAGAALVARLAALPGEVWVPSHPWYGHLAGKRMYVHRMGIKDVTVRKPRPVLGLDDALRTHRWSHVVVDGPRDVHLYGETRLPRHYRELDALAAGERPRSPSGAPVRPTALWVPIGPEPLPPGAAVVFDFEPAAGSGAAASGWPTGWLATGTAWGSGPRAAALPGQAPVRQAGGARWVSSMHGGDDDVGTLTSPPFVLDAPALSLRLSGGTEPALRVELVVDDAVVRRASPPGPPSERFREVTLDVAALRGRTARLRLVDEATGAWGHLNVDEVWLRR